MSNWKPSATFDTLRLRARLNAAIREFFARRGVLEVETPVMSQAGNTEPNIASFALEFSGRIDGGPRTRWLRTSPEHPLKRLLAAGLGDCYELGRVFRDGEAGGRHNPEFTMLEWYRLGMDHVQLAAETAELVRMALALVGREASIELVTYRDLYLRELGIDPMLAPDDALRDALGDVEIDPRGLVRDDWLDLLMTHRIQPGFPRDAILVVRDYPPSQCALARIRQPDHAAAADELAVAERFELYLGPLELANGYHELADADEQRARFERDLVVRQGRGLSPPGIDERLLAALAHGLPGCAGVALGVDRLLMAMLGTDAIADVLAFDFARA
ncbi:EF-P lysine aminoacylase EpmA [Luteimonas soli]|uniref:EF-P lysine aminoacylase EpmA n=1 Tax=Luteimonas soli TaxID=1648966 RepID=A0ABV7XGZ4_9GAMM